jgi:hypothetical protein
MTAKTIINTDGLYHIGFLPWLQSITRVFSTKDQTKIGEFGVYTVLPADTCGHRMRCIRNIAPGT